jgi:cellobiose-specific phosphotransferase system component IIC
VHERAGEGRDGGTGEGGGSLKTNTGACMAKKFLWWLGIHTPTVIR